MARNPFIRALNDTPVQGKPVFLQPCTVTTITPLTITLGSTTGLPAVKIPGVTYSLGPANALITHPGVPIVLPIG